MRIGVLCMARQNIKPAPLSFESSLRAASSLCVHAHALQFAVVCVCVCIAEGQREGALGVTCHLAIAVSVLQAVLSYGAKFDPPVSTVAFKIVTFALCLVLIYLMFLLDLNSLRKFFVFRLCHW